jgi:Flp pilus assembly protein TadG
MQIARGGGGEDGQSTVEFVALLPVLVGVALLAWQVLLVGESWWLASAAARDGARASALGGDARSAALGVLPSRLRSGARVSETSAGLRIRVRIPAVVAGLDLGSVTAEASMERQS